MSLSQLCVGDEAIVESIAGDDAMARRLQALGFVSGTRVHVRRIAPLGDPTEYELRGTRLCLRRSEARRIDVRRPS